MKKLFLLIILILLYSCGGGSSSPTGSTTTLTPVYDWTVPTIDLAGSLNPFPFIENPQFTTVSSQSSFQDNFLVAVISFDNEVRVYPYVTIDKYECVNDSYNGKTFAISHCPQTESAIAWNRSFQNTKLSIRSSGYLFRENLIALDKASDTFWSQMLLECVKGKYEGQKYSTYNLIETNWKTVKDLFPNAKVFFDPSQNSTSSNTQEVTISSSGKTTQTNKLTAVIPEGEDVYTILDQRAKTTDAHIYRYGMFTGGTKIYREKIGNKNLIIVGNSDQRFITSYINNENIEFTVLNNEFPAIMQDANGNKWNMFGVALSGPRQGEQLQSPNAYIAVWWAVKDFFTTIIRHDQV